MVVFWPLSVILFFPLLGNKSPRTQQVIILYFLLVRSSGMGKRVFWSGLSWVQVVSCSVVCSRATSGKEFAPDSIYIFERIYFLVYTWLRAPGIFWLLVGGHLQVLEARCSSTSGELLHPAFLLHQAHKDSLCLQRDAVVCCTTPWWGWHPIPFAVFCWF